ncbi:MAG: T9SS type A sorting domain-containing protein [Chitinophagales bacterium]
MKKLYLAIIGLFISAASFAQCSELFFSEYVEGSGNNKALEIYNPGSVAVNLNGYKIVQYNNGSATVSYTLNLNGTIGANDVYVLVRNTADSLIKLTADTLTGSNVLNFNGNDVLELLNGTTALDRIGNVGDTANIPFDTLTGKDNTFVRKPAIQNGNLNWASGQLEWIAFPKDTFRLGSHTMDPCGAIADTMVRFSPNAGSTSESAGTYNVALALNAASTSTTFTVDVELFGGTGTAADINNYTTQTVTFAPGSSSQNLTLTITDDALAEPSETFTFRLKNPSSPLLIGADSIFTLTIGASDVPVNTYAINQISHVNANGQPDSLGVKVQVSGTVYGINYRSTGLEFFIHDATDGIAVFSSQSNFGYVVTEGDSVTVVGEVSFFNGLTEVGLLDTVYKVGVGAVPAPTVVQDLDETTEAEIVRLNNVHLVTPSQWSNTGASGFTVDITDGQNTWAVKIDEQCALFTAPAPPANFNIIGIGTQFDNTSPYTGGYQLLPRFASDLILISGINETEVSNVQVYPNPCNGNFVVRLANAVNNAEVKLYNINGQLMHSEKTSGATITVNNTTLAAGLYLLEINAGNKIYRSKVSVQ